MSAENMFYKVQPVWSELLCVQEASIYSKHSYIKTTFETVQKWSERPLLDSLKGGL